MRSLPSLLDSSLVNSTKELFRQQQQQQQGAFRQQQQQQQQKTLNTRTLVLDL